MEKCDYTLEQLLNLNGDIYEVVGGFWIKIEAKRTKQVSPQKPFGIKYSLTLHSSNGERIIGYDNSHGMPGGKAEHAHDHQHKGGRIIAYNYINATKLLADFWADVDKILIGWGLI